MTLLDSSALSLDAEFVTRAGVAVITVARSKVIANDPTARYALSMPAGTATALMPFLSTDPSMVASFVAGGSPSITDADLIASVGLHWVELFTALGMM